MRELESDLLRTFLAIADTGSVTAGAAKIHRSQSAASIQLRNLETILGGSVFERHGRGVALSPVGEMLAPVARQVVQLLDTARNDITGEALQGTLRLGIPDDHSKDSLSRLIADFSHDHPNVRLEVHCAYSAKFSSALAAGGLDLAVYETGSVGRGMEVLQEGRMRWVARRGHNLLSQEPVPIALFDRNCWWRDAAMDALRSSTREFRIVYTSESIAGVTAAIQAGIAIGVLSEPAITGDLEILPESHGLGELPLSIVVLEQGAKHDQPICQAMAKSIRQAYARARSSKNPLSRRRRKVKVPFLAGH